MVVRAARRRRKASSTAHPTTAPTQVCPFATRRGRRLGVALSLVTFFRRRERKLLACRATPGLRPEPKAVLTNHPARPPPSPPQTVRKPHELRQTRPSQPVGIHYKNNSYQRFTSRRRKRFSPKKSIPYLQPTPVLHQTRLLQSLHHHLRRRRQQPVRPRNDSERIHMARHRQRQHRHDPMRRVIARHILRHHRNHVALLQHARDEQQGRCLHRVQRRRKPVLLEHQVKPVP